jgi:hypothetical protein
MRKTNEEDGKPSKDGSKEFAANCGQVGERIPRTGHGIGCHVIDSRSVAGANGVRQRRIGCFVRVALISGFVRVQGKEEEDHAHNLGCFRRNDTANEDSVADISAELTKHVPMW